MANGNEVSCFARRYTESSRRYADEGMVVLWGPNVLCWKSGRQSLTATNTSEAELFGADDAGEALKAMHLVRAK
eukprot:6483047-Amphidinium_carterae.1